MVAIANNWLKTVPDKSVEIFFTVGLFVARFRNQSIFLAMTLPKIN